MYFFKTPVWLHEFEYPYEKYEDIPDLVFDQINKALDSVQSKQPLISILIPAWNEEVNILRCISSLSRMKTQLPFEIIVVNNNSKRQNPKYHRSPAPAFPVPGNTGQRTSPPNGPGKR